MNGDGNQSTEKESKESMKHRGSRKEEQSRGAKRGEGCTGHDRWDESAPATVRRQISWSTGSDVRLIETMNTSFGAWEYSIGLLSGKGP